MTTISYKSPADRIRKLNGSAHPTRQKLTQLGKAEETGCGISRRDRLQLSADYLDDYQQVQPELEAVSATLSDIEQSIQILALRVKRVDAPPASIAHQCAFLVRLGVDSAALDRLHLKLAGCAREATRALTAAEKRWEEVETNVRATNAMAELQTTLSDHKWNPDNPKVVRAKATYRSLSDEHGRGRRAQMRATQREEEKHGR